jgi:hypothetical protein
MSRRGHQPMRRLESIVLPLVISASIFTLGACRKSSEDAEKKEETATAAAPTEEKKASRPKPPPVDEGIDVPTEEDFEDAVSTQITETSNLDKELDRLEKEIGKLPGAK